MVSIWQISPGREERGLWPEFKRDSIIGMGWDKLGKLKPNLSDDDIAAALKKEYPVDYPKESYPLNDIKSIKVFSQLIKKGDIIVAKKGSSKELYGIGIAAGNYYCNPKRENFQHVIDVDWIIGFDQKVEVNLSKQFVQWTADNLRPERFVEIRESLVHRFPTLKGAFEKMENRSSGNSEINEAIYHKILQSLEMKKQVILYGPPGTGKTWVAKKFVNQYIRGNRSTEKTQKELFKFKGLTFSGFTKQTFDFLTEINNNNSKKWMDSNRNRYKAYVDEPLRNLTDVIGRNCIKRLNENFVTFADNRTVLSRITKNVFGATQAIYWSHMWSAFYRKSIGDKRKDAQLFMVVNPDGLRYGFGFGNLVEARNVENKFKENVNAQVDYFFKTMKELNVLNEFDFQFNDTATDKRVGMRILTLDNLREWLKKDHLAIATTFKPQEIAELDVNAQANIIADAFTKLYPAYLFATSETPVEDVEEFLAGAEEVIDPSTFVRFVSFHQSYSYEEFVEGIRPVILDKGTIGHNRDFEITKGIFKRVCDDAKKDQDNDYFLIIDEINRGQISKIFGELITLLEKDKRLSQSGEVQENTIVLDLVYSKEPFAVPWNVYIIGTMNTADKSIALVDIALRRRFAFIEITPNPSLLKVFDIQGITVNLPKILESINNKIAIMIDNDHQVGHSYLMNIDRTPEGLLCTDQKILLENLRFAFYNEILPLLQEYFYNDWEKLQQVVPKFVKTIIKPDDAAQKVENGTQGVYKIADELDDSSFLKALSEL